MARRAFIALRSDCPLCYSRHGSSDWPARRSRMLPMFQKSDCLVCASYAPVRGTETGSPGRARNENALAVVPPPAQCRPVTIQNQG